MIVKDVQTFSIVVGDTTCNARCPYCVSQMTTAMGTDRKFDYPNIDWSNFGIATAIAQAAHAGTVLFTGKGEPLLHPQQITDYLVALSRPEYAELAQKEVQSNGLVLAQPAFQQKEWLERWYDLGLRVVSLSVVDVKDKVNHRIYNPHQSKYPSLKRNIELLHKQGYNVRLSITMIKDAVDGPDDLERVLEFCKINGVEQCSVRPVRKPNVTKNQTVSDWVTANQLTSEQERAIVDYVESRAKAGQNGDAVIQKLVHGAVVYQLGRQNFCLTDCLTLDSGDQQFRQLIFYSNSMVSTDWSHPGAQLYSRPGKNCLRWLKTQPK